MCLYTVTHKQNHVHTIKWACTDYITKHVTGWWGIFVWCQVACIVTSFSVDSVPGCQAPQQLQPIRMSQLMFCAKNNQKKSCLRVASSLPLKLLPLNIAEGTFDSNGVKNLRIPNQTIKVSNNVRSLYQLQANEADYINLNTWIRLKSLFFPPVHTVSHGGQIEGLWGERQALELTMKPAVLFHLDTGFDHHTVIQCHRTYTRDILWHSLRLVFAGICNHMSVWHC